MSVSVPVESVARAANPPVEASLFSPLDHPALFTGGQWPTLARPQTTVFENRFEASGRRRSLDDSTLCSAVHDDALTWYQQQVQRHGVFKQSLRDAEHRGRWMGAAYGLITIIASPDVWSHWSIVCLPPVPDHINLTTNAPPPTAAQAAPTCETSLPAIAMPSYICWTSKELGWIKDAYAYGSTVGCVIHLVLWVVVFLAISIIVGTVGGAGAALASVIAIDAAFLVLLIGVSCYSGRKRKQSEYHAVLVEDLPRDVPSLVQIEMMQRNARITKRLLSSKQSAAVAPLSSVMQRAREDLEADEQITALLSDSFRPHRQAMSSTRGPSHLVNTALGESESELPAVHEEMMTIVVVNNDAHVSQLGVSDERCLDP